MSIRNTCRVRETVNAHAERAQTGASSDWQRSPHKHATRAGQRRNNEGWMERKDEKTLYLGRQEGGEPGGGRRRWAGCLGEGLGNMSDREQEKRESKKRERARRPETAPCVQGRSCESVRICLARSAPLPGPKASVRRCSKTMVRRLRHVRSWLSPSGSGCCAKR